MEGNSPSVLSPANRELLDRAIARAERMARALNRIHELLKEAREKVNRDALSREIAQLRGENQRLRNVLSRMEGV